MRRYLASAAAVGTALLLAGPVMAADMPEYPEIPEVDYDIGGSFYLRGSAALNIHWAPEVKHPWDPADIDPIVEYGYGYSWGAGFGYETGTGLRFDGTIDSVETKGLMITKTGTPPPVGDAGDYTLMLRSTVALANIYYDFGLGGDFSYSSGAGGAFGYVGAGAGLAWNHAETNSPWGVPVPVPTGGNVSAAATVELTSPTTSTRSGARSRRTPSIAAITRAVCAACEPEPTWSATSGAGRPRSRKKTSDSSRS